MEIDFSAGEYLWPALPVIAKFHGGSVDANETLFAVAAS